jgi:ElaB/YqjD/DUF883 family membrane-anchored ribosome-binding protein
MNTQENHPAVLDQVVTGAGQQIRETAGRLGGTIIRTSEGSEESLDDIETNIRNVRDPIVNKTKEYWRTTNGYLSKNPWVGIGVSIGFAFLAGILIGRRQ